jgi:hypothetical protein
MTDKEMIRPKIAWSESGYPDQAIAPVSPTRKDALLTIRVLPGSGVEHMQQSGPTVLPDGSPPTNQHRGKGNGQKRGEMDGKMEK